MKERVSDDTPIIVGVGQVSDKRGQSGYQAYSPVELAAESARLACEDALSAALASDIDVVVAVRTTADSRPASMRAAAAPFGWADNMPGAISRRLGAERASGVYSPACGDEPQKLVAELCERLHAGEHRLVVICGAEATSTLRGAQAAGESHDWSETVDRPLEDRGPQTEGTRSEDMTRHKMLAPLSVYPLFEQARRKRTGLTREAYRDEIGRLFAPFTEVAAANPHAFSQKRLSPDQIATVTDDNRMVADPYTRTMVAREQVNLGAAVLLSTVGAAREMGIPESKWIYLHGYSSTKERHVMERRDLGRSPAMALAYEHALDCAGVSISDIRYLDIYSCYPIAVFAAIETLGIALDDPRGLTLTGGLPYFGGPGNDYSMHAIVELVERLRKDRDALGLIGANGGFLSTHAVGIYSARPRRWSTCDNAAQQAEIDAHEAPAFVQAPSGNATIESYTVLYDRGKPTDVVVVGRLKADDSRFLAIGDGDEAIVRRFTEDDPIDERITVASDKGVNRFQLLE